MKKFFVLVAVIAVAAFAAFDFTRPADAGVTSTIPFDKKSLKDAESGIYNFDKAHSFIGFKVKHMGLIDVPGYFRDFTGTVNYDAADVSKSTVEFTAKATSVDTGVAGRDNHLRSADFFEVEKYPTITFKSTKIEKAGNGWRMTGNLTMHGVTKQVELAVEGPAAPIKAGKALRSGASASTRVNRKDFGLNWSRALETGGVVVGDEVDINIEVELIQKLAE